ncbi:MAG: prealbumin-like fold domain-containing protein [Clostridium sp.]|nr:prealbumin-like fold domain-containing protein [Clostridium sp.]
MKNIKLKQILAMLMALVLTVTAVVPSGFAFAASDTNVDESQELKVYDKDERTDLDATEVVVAEDLNVLIDSDFDVTDTHDGITYNASKVIVTYDQDRSNFDIHNVGTFNTYYKVEPVSGKTAYLIVRKVTVKEPEVTTDSDASDNNGDDSASSDDEDGPSDMVGEKADFKNYPLSEGEIESISSNEATITIRLDEEGNVDWDENSVEESNDTDTQVEDTGDDSEATPEIEESTEASSDETADAGVFDKIKDFFASAVDSLFPAMTAYAAEKGDTMKVSYSGYAKYCGHSIGIKYISESGDYYHHLVYCMDLNKGTTSGTTTATTGGSKIKPAVTYCLVNGARTLGGTCHTSKYSAGSAAADYFITSAAIHICNGEISLSYYNNGSSVYNKIKALVEDAKAAANTDAYDAGTGYTKSISYDISPKKSDWEQVEDGLYRTKDKFVRTKSGTITDVKYSITGAPSGLTTGEVKTDANKINDENDLKKYDICIAQTDASSASSNFYLYCNSDAMEKIQKNNSVIKLKAKAYSKEYGGRKWSPTVVSQQKITFLEQFTPSLDSATVKVTANFKEGSFSLQKNDVFTHAPVPGATYYLYEDKDCQDLLCKMPKTGADGLTISGKQILTEEKYYLKEVLEPNGYQPDEKVYELGLEYFTLYDASGNITQQGKTMSVDETPEPVGVIVRKKDAFSKNEIKNAGFAVFNDRACTVRTKVAVGESDVPIFHYSEDLGFAASEKFIKTQEVYYVKEVEVPAGYKDEGKIWEVRPNYGEFATISVPNTPIRCDVQADKKDKETADPQADAKLEGATYGLYAAEDIVYPDGTGVVTYKV